nr:methylmalonyl-CoA mutase family protein [Bacteroidota bacterium]
MSNFRLFDGFDRSTKKDWEERALRELKDASLKDRLTHVIDDHIAIDSYISSEEATVVNDRPGELPLVRGVKRAGNAWRVTQPIDVDDPAANDTFLNALMCGADSVELHGSESHITSAVRGVQLSAIDIQLAEGSVAALRWFIHEAERQDVPKHEFSFCASLSKEADLSGVKELIAKYPLLRLYSVNDHRISTKDGMLSSTLEVLRAARSVLEKLIHSGFTIDDAAARIQFKLHIGDDLFVEAARMRAMRQIWAEVIAAKDPHHA